MSERIVIRAFTYAGKAFIKTKTHALTSTVLFQSITDIPVYRISGTINFQVVSLSNKVPVPGDEVSSVRYKVSSVRYKVSSVRYKVPSLRYKVPSLRYKVSSLRYKVSSLSYKVPSVRYKVLSVRYKVPSLSNKMIILSQKVQYQVNINISGLISGPDYIV
jgi:hypothetical protein